MQTYTMQWQKQSGYMSMVPLKLPSVAAVPTVVPALHSGNYIPTFLSWRITVNHLDQTLSQSGRELLLLEQPASDNSAALLYLLCTQKTGWFSVSTSASDNINLRLKDGLKDALRSF